MKERVLGEEVYAGRRYGVGHVTEIGPPDRTRTTDLPEWIGVTPRVAGYQMKFSAANIQDWPQ